MKITTLMLLKNNSLNLFGLAIFFAVAGFFTVELGIVENANYWCWGLGVLCFICSVSNFLLIKNKKG